ncbi:hypothetical protein [Curtobacterium sp. MCLR17_042]|jgi:hypothetical protein|uniref:hypothetical protein n=1 Tax=Curtobacterium sp. MCLR17_042 TaxID=2175626 RepID=UPI000DA7CCF3|nr:hypothetical protein [Curtobacterium sp. MCLR17_042]PZE24646.1 hypothetical protein DEJ02_14755 [Curtobacterium sp. MCLR17_042]
MDNDQTRVEAHYPFTNTYWVDGRVAWQDDYYHVPLERGDGVIQPGQGGIRARVEDVWYSQDKHGYFAVGRHVFLRDVTGTEDDRLGNMAPDYFATDAE